LQAKASTDDHAVRAAVEATDVAVLRAIAAEAAGSNPIVSPPPNAVLSTPGMDWLERMRAEDAALQRAVEQNDILLKKQ
jgi:O-methyltransferase involved in polyketide biosynthesis